MNYTKIFHLYQTLLHVAIVIGVQGDASGPSEDALLSVQNDLLCTDSTRLGTYLIGFIIEAMKRKMSLRKVILVFSILI